MVGDAVDRVRAALQAHGSRIEGRKPDDFMAQCPEHDDGRPSLHVSQGSGKALLHCHAKCTPEAIVSALGLTMADLADEPGTRGAGVRQRYHPKSYDPEQPVPNAFTASDEPADDEALPWAPAAPAGGDPPGNHAPCRTDAVAEYPYFDETGTLRVVVARTAAKGFPCYVPATGHWSLGADETVKRALWAVPYNLPALAADGGVRGRTLFVVEGEKDVHALAARGLYATTRLGSAKEWVDELSARLAQLAPLQVVVVEDRDRDGKQAGAKKAADACESLRRVLSADVPVKRILLPPVVNGYRVKDAADFFAAGGTLKALRGLVDAAPPIPTWLDTFAPRADVLMANPALLAPPPVVVPRLAWAGRLTLVSAAPKMGKSSLVGQAAASLTQGAPFLDGTSTPGRVLWFALDESQGEAIKRLHDHGFDPAMTRITREVPTPETMRRAVAEYQPTLVVLDALSDLIQTARKDENSPEAGHHLKAVCGHVAHDTGVAFIVIHHLKKDGSGARGSTAIEAVPDVLVKLLPTKARRTVNRDEQEPEDDAPGAPEPRTLTAKGRGVGFGVTLHYDGTRYAMEKSPATDGLRVLHVLLNQPGGMSRNAVASLVGGQRARVLALLDEQEAAGYVHRTGTGPASRMVITETGREYVMGQHPDLADRHFPTLPSSAPAIGSGDLPEEMQREPVAEGGNLASVPISSSGTGMEAVGNRWEAVSGTDTGLFSGSEGYRFPTASPRGGQREPIAAPAAVVPITDLMDEWLADDVTGDA
jgi:hypothetical protein